MPPGKLQMFVMNGWPWKIIKISGFASLEHFNLEFNRLFFFFSLQSFEVHIQWCSSLHTVIFISNFYAHLEWGYKTFLHKKITTSPLGFDIGTQRFIIPVEEICFYVALSSCADVYLYVEHMCGGQGAELEQSMKMLGEDQCVWAEGVPAKCWLRHIRHVFCFTQVSAS